MLFDVWSPLNLTSLVAKDLNSLVTFVGFVLLTGTILGIILDGIHHTIIEDNIWDKFEGTKELIRIRNKWLSICMGKNDLSPCGKDCITCEKDCQTCSNERCKIRNLRLTRHYSFKLIEAKLAELNNYFTEEYYSYSEFYSNTFLALVPFSVIAPFFIYKAFGISWTQSILFGIVSLFLACICLNSSYTAYKAYITAMNSAIFGYLNAPITITRKKSTQFERSTGSGVSCKITYVDETSTVEIEPQRRL